MAAKGAAESLRLAADLARALDALLIEEVDPGKLAEAVAEADDVARHWQKSLEQLKAIVRFWPGILAERGAIDLAERRNILLHRIAERWRDTPPPGFTIAAGITTAAPAIAALQARIARMPGGEVVLPGLWLDDVMPAEEWDALGPDDNGRIEANHPQYHLKLLLDRIGVNRAEVRPWPVTAGAKSPPKRARAVANAMAAPAFSHKWETLKRPERHLDNVRLAEFPDAAAEAQGIALALREAIEVPGRTAALVTPDRQLAARVSALLGRWGIEADDSAGQPLSQSPAASLILALGAAAAEELAPVALLALLKHPLVGGEGQDRLDWLDSVRELDFRLRGPRPAAGLAGLDRHFEGGEAASHWARVRPLVAPLDGLFATPLDLAAVAAKLAACAEALAGTRAWSGADGRMTAELLGEWQALPSSASSDGRQRRCDSACCASCSTAIRCARLMASTRGCSSGGCSKPASSAPTWWSWAASTKAVWPALSAPDPWLPPRVRATLGMPTLESRIGLTAHDFASALGAPEVLITRARRDSRSPTVASRFWLRLKAVDPDLAEDHVLPRLAIALDDPGTAEPAGQPAPIPALDQRPKVISVTDVDRLKADPFAFYAKAILRLRPLDPIDQDPTAAWKGTAVHDVLEQWFKEDGCDPDALIPRAQAMLRQEAVHPLLRALWQPRLMDAIHWVIGEMARDREAGRLPIAAEIKGKAMIAGVELNGKADRIDRNAAGALAIVDYKTGKAPTHDTIAAGFALQLGLLGLIAEAGGFPDIEGLPQEFEYWSFAGGGKRVVADKKIDDFLGQALANFDKAAGDWLTGMRPFTAKLNPAYAPYGDYDQLMRLEEWYGRN